MRIPYIRILILGVAVEAAAIGILAALVAIFGPHEPAADQVFAERLGQFVGPIGGTALCFLGAWWLTRRMKSARVLTGFLVGAAASTVDLALFLPAGVPFRLLFGFSLAARMVAGALGGWISRVAATADRC
jgi:hypothetical protein